MKEIKVKDMTKDSTKATKGRDVKNIKIETENPLKMVARGFVSIFEFITKYFKTVVFLTILFFVFTSSSSDGVKKSNANLAKLYLVEAIFDSESFLEKVVEIKKDTNIMGVLLIVDSPGGALGASIEIADSVKELKNIVPVVTYVKGTMASGSYYGGMYADKIIANRGAMIGSIGVIFDSVNIEELAKKIGIKSQTLKAGEYKEIGTYTREWSEKERRFLDSLLQEQYNMFIDDVVEARGLKRRSEERRVGKECTSWSR